MTPEQADDEFCTCDNAQANAIQQMHVQLGMDRIQSQGNHQYEVSNNQITGGGIATWIPQQTIGKGSAGASTRKDEEDRRCLIASTADVPVTPAGPEPTPPHAHQFVFANRTGVGKCSCGLTYDLPTAEPTKPATPRPTCACGQEIPERTADKFDDDDAPNDSECADCYACCREGVYKGNIDTRIASAQPVEPEPEGWSAWATPTAEHL